MAMYPDIFVMFFFFVCFRVSFHVLLHDIGGCLCFHVKGTVCMHVCTHWGGGADITLCTVSIIANLELSMSRRHLWNHWSDLIPSCLLCISSCVFVSTAAGDPRLLQPTRPLRTPPSFPSSARPPGRSPSSGWAAVDNSATFLSFFFFSLPHPTRAGLLLPLRLDKPCLSFSPSLPLPSSLHNNPSAAHWDAEYLKHTPAWVMLRNMLHPQNSNKLRREIWEATLVWVHMCMHTGFHQYKHIGIYTRCRIFGGRHLQHLAWHFAWVWLYTPAFLINGYSGCGLTYFIFSLFYLDISDFFCFSYSPLFFLIIFFKCQFSSQHFRLRGALSVKYFPGVSASLWFLFSSSTFSSFYNLFFFSRPNRGPSPPLEDT